jgi:hypothetical protein
LVFSGAAVLSRTKAYTPAGGLQLGGAAAVARVRSVTPAGGIVFAGAAALARVRVPLVGGPLVFGGAGSTSFTPGATTHTYVPSGGIHLAGAGVTSFVGGGSDPNDGPWWPLDPRRGLDWARRKRIRDEDDELLIGKE